MDYSKKISIIILSWNGKEILENCINSVLGCLNEIKNRSEIIIVDNGSQKETITLLEKYRSNRNFKIIKNKKNLGFSIGNNVGFKNAQGEYILFLNQDVECINSAILKLIKFLDEHQDFDAVAPQLLYPNGKIQVSCRPFYNWGILLKELITLGKYKESFYDHTKSQKVDQPMASVLLIRKNVLEKVGGFDEHPDFWLYFNDVDLSYRLSQKGHFCYFLSEAQFFHYHGQSAYNLKSIKRIWLWHKGLKRFFLKHKIRSKWFPSFWFLLFLMIFSFLGMNLRQLLGSILKGKEIKNEEKNFDNKS